MITGEFKQHVFDEVVSRSAYDGRRQKSDQNCEHEALRSWVARQIDGNLQQLG